MNKDEFIAKNKQYNAMLYLNFEYELNKVIQDEIEKFARHLSDLEIRKGDKYLIDDERCELGWFIGDEFLTDKKLVQNYLTLCDIFN